MTDSAAMTAAIATVRRRYRYAHLAGNSDGSYAVTYTVSKVSRNWHCIANGQTPEEAWVNASRVLFNGDLTP